MSLLVVATVFVLYYKKNFAMFMSPFLPKSQNMTQYYSPTMIYLIHICMAPKILCSVDDNFAHFLLQVKKTFRAPSWWDHHETWKDMRYNWLPTWKEVPKHLHERPHVSHLKDLEVR
jgi:hypothetical protein